MKVLSVLTIFSLAAATLVAQPAPQNEREKKESKKEAKIARMKAKENNKRYRHEARDKKRFNRQSNSM